MPRIRILVALFALLIAVPAWAIGPAIVQTANNSGGSTPGTGMTYGATPTPGNIDLCWLFTSSNSFTPNSSAWTTYQQNGIGSSTQAGIFYRYVQAGDTTALPALAVSGTPFWASECAEISGVSATFANVVEQNDSINPATVTTLTTNSVTTTHANDLAVIGVANFDAGSNITGGSGFTFKVQQNNFGNYGAWALLSAPFASSGSAFSTAFTIPTGASHQSAYYTVVIRPASAAAAGKLLFHVFP